MAVIFIITLATMEFEIVLFWYLGLETGMELPKNTEITL